METETSYTNNPLMTPAKQQRIANWRDQVALSLPPMHDAPSLASSQTSSASSASSASVRPRSLWRRLSSRLSIRSASSRGRRDYLDLYAAEGSGQARMAGLVDDEEEEEEQRQRQRQRQRQLDDPPVESPGALDDDHSSHEGGRGLKDKQDRLRRAARLLHQGVHKDADAPAQRT